MNEALNLVGAWVVGVGVGAVFFGGLWWTISHGLSSRTPALWFCCSLVFRTGVALAGFYFMAQGRWERLLACLLGFVTGRVVVNYLTRPAAVKRTFSTKGSSHAN